MASSPGNSLRFMPDFTIEDISENQTMLRRPENRIAHEIEVSGEKTAKTATAMSYQQNLLNFSSKF